MSKSFAAGLIAVVAAVAATASAHAADYPSQPIKIIVGYTPGSTADILARVVGDELSKRLGQSIVVDNRDGAGTTISANIAARARPDGYTLYVAPVAFAINPKLYARLEHDPFRDFVPITLAARSPNLLVVNNDLPVKNMAEFVALAKTQPGRLQYASSGKGTSSYLNTELLKSMAGIDLAEIPYKATSQALTDTIGGQVQMNFPSLAAVLPQVRAGRVRALGVSGAQRSPAAPDIPTVGETVAGYEASGWFGYFAPAKTPPEIVARLYTEIAAVLKIPQVREKLEAQGLDIVGSTPAELAAEMKAAADKWGTLIDRLGIASN